MTYINCSKIVKYLIELGFSVKILIRKSASSLGLNEEGIMQYEPGLRRNRCDT